MSGSLVSVEFPRALCCHANSEIFERVLQFVLYQRRLLPFHIPDILARDQPTEPASPPVTVAPRFRVFVDGRSASESSEDSTGGNGTLLEDPLGTPGRATPPSADCDVAESLSREELRFLEQYDGICAALREAFRSRLAGVVREAALVLGPAWARPAEIYRLRWEWEREGGVEDACEGRPLSPPDQRLLAQALLKSRIGDGEALGGVGKSLKAGLLLRAHRDAVLPDTSPLSAFRVPGEDEARKRKIAIHEISLEKPANPVYFREAVKEEEMMWFVVDASISSILPPM